MTSNGNEAQSEGRVALLSDVHGNLPALEAVLADINEQLVDEAWCLGDLVGYGANPDEVVALTRDACTQCLAGNHDLGVLGAIDISDFSDAAAAAAIWTRRNASQETLAFLGSLEPSSSTAPIGLYHGSPRNPVWEYVLSTGQADECMNEMPQRVAAIGHTHVASRFSRDTGGTSFGEHVTGGTTLDISGGDWLVNPGSVGQPRDGDPRAAWLLIDFDAWTAEWRRVEYEVDRAAGAIEEAGLPSHLGTRLYAGQ